MTPAEARQALLDALTVERFTAYVPERPGPDHRGARPTVRGDSRGDRARDRDVHRLRDARPDRPVLSAMPGHPSTPEPRRARLRAASA
jgi:hypothetical protein